MKRRHALVATLAAPAWAQPAPPLQFTLAPFLSAVALLASYRPLREHLQQRLARPVEMLTTRDFRTLVDGTHRAEHEVVQLPAHLARMAMVDWGWQPLPSSVEHVMLVIAVRTDGPLRRTADLRGQSIAMLDPLSLSATAARRWLRREKLAGAVDVVTMASVNSALHALERGEVAAIAVADTQIRAAPPGTPRPERVLHEVTVMPAPQYMARPGTGAAAMAALSAALQSFVPDPGRPRSAPNSLLRWAPASQWPALDDYAAEARSLLR